jgi:glutamate racemase
MNEPIGIIDSGVGGLSIASVLIKKFPKESVIYLADSKNCPYGSKSDDEIYKLSKKMIGFLTTQRIKMLIIACNTITVTSIDNLRKDNPSMPIIGIVPVIKTAVDKTKNKKIGIFSTSVTAESKYQKKLIGKYTKGYSVINLGSSDLVPIIEKLDFKKVEKTLNKELLPFKKAGVDTLALGCSHFPLIKKYIQKILPNVLILDSSGAVCRQVEKILIKNQLLSKSVKPSYNFYTTGDLQAMSFLVYKLTNKAKLSRISLP